jgi:hypothetical protein
MSSRRSDPPRGSNNHKDPKSIVLGEFDRVRLKLGDVESDLVRQQPANDHVTFARQALWEAQVILENAVARLETLLADMRPVNDTVALQDLLKEYLGALPTARPPRRDP